MASGETPQIVFGHPEFGVTVVRSFPRFFQIATRANQGLLSLTDRAYREIQPLQRTILNLASYVAIGAAEAVTLVGNGLGGGAVKVLRGMLEATINAEYLRLNAAELDSFLDWAWVEQHKLYDFLREHRPESYAQISEENRRITENEWARIRNRFEYVDRNNRTRLQDSWTRLNLADRAVRASLIEPYRYIYPIGSKLIHGTVSGLAMHFDEAEDPHRLAAPPTLSLCGEALIGVHLCVIAATRTLSQSVGIEPMPSIEDLEADFHTVWADRPH